MATMISVAVRRPSSRLSSSDVGLPRADVIRARRPSFRSDGLADNKRDGLGFRYCDKL